MFDFERIIPIPNLLRPYKVSQISSFPGGSCSLNFIEKLKNNNIPFNISGLRSVSRKFDCISPCFV